MIILYIAAIAFAFGLVIFVHEFGHFIVAKKTGVKVDRFSFGLGPEAIGFQWGETRYCIAWIPLGGEVRMAGEFPQEEETKKGETSEPSGLPVDRSRDFFNFPWYRRLPIVLAGPFMNYVLAVVMFSLMFLAWGELVPSNEPVVGEVVSGMPAESAGLRSGDRILKVEDEKIENFLGLAKVIHDRPDEATRLLIERRGREFTVTLTPEKNEKLGIGLIGVRPPQPTRRDVGVWESLTKGVERCWFISVYTLSYLGQKIWMREKPDVAGPLGIGQVIVEKVKSGWEDYLYLIAMISVAIGLFNLFPIPLLDGGHLLYYVIEGIRGKPLSLKTMGRANTLGFALLMTLLVYATFNDIQRFRAPKDPPRALEKK